MAKQTAQVGSVLTKVNVNLAIHANDETVDRGFIDLPSGISGGIAQLVEFRFVRTKADSPQYPDRPMLQAVGIVKAPAVHEGIPIVGLRTTHTELLCDTIIKSKNEKVSEQQHYAEVMNLMRLLSGNPKFTTNVKVAADLEPLAASLERAKPHFRFDTWGGGEYETVDPTTKKKIMKKSRVNSRWHGYVEFNANGDAAAHPSAAATQEAPAGESADEYAAAEAADDQANAAAQNAADAAAPSQMELPEDLDELVALADAEDEGDEDSPEVKQHLAARQKLLDLAIEAGVDEQEAKDANTYAAVKELIDAASTPAEEPAPEPAVGEVWQFHPVDAKGKKSAKPVDCKIVKIDKVKGKATVKNIATKKDVVVNVSDLIAK